MKPNALFLTNTIYVDESTREGGVKMCTKEYIELIQCLFNVSLFKVKNRTDFFYKIKVKLGLNVYDDYKIENYKNSICCVIIEEKISYVFLNLSNTSRFAEFIKDEFGDSIKVVLCSHGNESGDYLHDATKFIKEMPLYKRLFSSFTLGRLLKKEVEFRQKYFNGVLTVSPVEVAIEQWLGAKYVMMVPRTISPQFVTWNPIQGRVGFIGDLSHLPNLFGINEVCKKLSQNTHNSLEVRIVGSPKSFGERLQKKYDFVKYMGYLNDTKLQNEIASWSLFLNPVFYYSRGVSTKLAKGLSWGLPILTTLIGTRGYLWGKGNFIFAETPSSMAKKITDYSNDMIGLKESKRDIEYLVNSMSDLQDVSIELDKFLNSL